MRGKHLRNVSLVTYDVKYKILVYLVKILKCQRLTYVCRLILKCEKLSNIQYPRIKLSKEMSFKDFVTRNIFEVSKIALYVNYTKTVLIFLKCKIVFSACLYIYLFTAHCSVMRSYSSH